MVQSLTEGQHPSEFIVSEFDTPNYCREVAVVSSGQNLVDGQLVQLSGSELVAKDTDVDTEGAFTTAIEGIVIGNWNASSTGTNADIPDVPYLKRGPAVVADALLTYPSVGTKAQAVADLLALGIVVR